MRFFKATLELYESMAWRIYFTSRIHYDLMRVGREGVGWKASFYRGLGSCKPHFRHIYVNINSKWVQMADTSTCRDGDEMGVEGEVRASYSRHVCPHPESNFARPFSPLWKITQRFGPWRIILICYMKFIWFITGPNKRVEFSPRISPTPFKLHLFDFFSLLMHSGLAASLLTVEKLWCDLWLVN